jgi:hypothetical protein
MHRRIGAYVDTRSDHTGFRFAPITAWNRPVSALDLQVVASEKRGDGLPDVRGANDHGDSIFVLSGRKPAGGVLHAQCYRGGAFRARAEHNFTTSSWTTEREAARGPADAAPEFLAFNATTYATVERTASSMAVLTA